MTPNTILVDAIAASKTNPRKHFDKAALQELAESIARHGVLQPIRVRPNGSEGTYELVAGERRWRAAKIAQLERIPATVRELTDAEVVEIQIIENLHRIDLHPLEEAEGYESLMKCQHADGHAYTADEIAAKVGKSRSYVYQRLKLCALVPAAREAFYDGHLDASKALLVARVPADLQKEALERLLGDDYYQPSFREARDMLQREFMLELGKKPPFDVKAIYFADGKANPIGPPCAECPKRTGNQPELFEDVKSGDVCTDPGCFRAKTAAAAEKQAEELRAKGHEVLIGPEARKILTSDWAPAKKGYARLDKPLNDDPKFKALGERLKMAKVKDLPAVFVEHPAQPGEFVKCVLEASARERLIAAGEKWADKAAKSKGVEPVGKRRDYETEYAIELAIHKALREAVREKGLDEKALRTVVMRFMDYLSTVIADAFPDAWTAPNKMPSGELMPALVDCAFSEGDLDRDRHELAAHYGIDVKAIEKRVKAERKAQAEAEAAQKPAKPTKKGKAAPQPVEAAEASA